MGLALVVDLAGAVLTVGVVEAAGVAVDRSKIPQLEMA